MTSSGTAGLARLPDAARGYLADPALAEVWAVVAQRLERNGLNASGTVTLTVDEPAATALSGLLGSRMRTGRVRLRLGDLDAALRRSAAAAGLVAVLGSLRGTPLRDLAAAKAEAVQARADTVAALDAALAAAGLAGAPWAAGFVDGVRRAGVLTRAGDAASAAVAGFGAALADLAAAGVFTGARHDGSVGWELGELASRCTGDAHGLDEGRVVAALVLRAAAAALGVPLPATPAGRRALWGRLGVDTDQVSGVVLVWGLRPPGDGGWATMMRARADLGLVTPLTLQELRSAAAADSDLVPARQLVSACENPQVLQAAARAGVAGPLVCTSGNPASAGWLLLRRLVDVGARVRYHGDFDWPGVAIAGRVFAAGAVPWRMAADDYTAAVAGLPADSRLGLDGARVATPWDGRLAATMVHHGVAVHEESLLEVLLADL